MEQAVACEPVTQRARVPSPAGTNFQGEVFSGFSSPVRQMSGSFRPTKVLEYHLTIMVILSFHLIRMNGCVNGAYRLSCSCCLGGGPSIELIPHPGDPSSPFVVKKVNL